MSIFPALRTLWSARPGRAKRRAATEEKYNYLRASLGENLGRTPQDINWLLDHRRERMDAQLPIYSQVRRKFHLARYEFARNHLGEGRVVDAACGTGYGTALLSHRASHALGVDICAQAIAYASRNYGGARVSFAVSDIGQMELPEESLDGVVTFETLEHVPDDDAAVRKLVAGLRPGGTFIASVPTWPHEITSHHVRTYTMESFRALLAPHLSTISFFNQNSGLNWEYNHGQPAGIVPTTADNDHLAEVWLAVGTKS